MGESSPAKYSVAVEENATMRTRDGVTLEADIFRPDAEGVFPTLVLRTPYSRRIRGQLSQSPDVQFFPARGYVVVLQDTRGRGASEGSYYPFFGEGPDTYDTVEWAAALPWSSGRVGTLGSSYLAAVQYAVLGLNPPHLRAMSPVSGPANAFTSAIFRRGVFEMRWRLAYFTAMERGTYHRAGRYRQERARLDSYVTQPGAVASLLTDEAYRHLPLKDWGDRLRGDRPYLAEFIDHSKDGPFWQEHEARRQAANVATPILHIGSWYDAFMADTVGMFEAIRNEVPSPEIRQQQRLVMRPGAHLGFAGPTTPEQQREMAAEAEEVRELQLRWFDHLLKGIDTGLLAEPPVRLFVMGRGRWRDENEWPLARTSYTNLFLHSGGRANTIDGDGRLSFEGPTDEPADSYLFDPHDPVPTVGGTIIGVEGGVRDQRQVEGRPDVLVYTSDPLPVDLEVTGPVRMTLYAASSAPDTDFTAKLVDVHPDGFAANIVEGVVRARFRESLTDPTPISPGRVYRLPIDLWSTSQVFLAGHAIRLEVSSSNFPRYDRNANTGLPFGEDSRLATARQTVFHDGSRPSHVVLPIIPG